MNFSDVYENKIKLHEHPKLITIKASSNPKSFFNSSTTSIILTEEVSETRFNHSFVV